MAEIIRTENLQYAYPADEGAEPVLALKGVDLTIEQGSFVVVLGHNGSGKSTLAKTLNGVLLPCGGHVYVEGMDTLDEHLLLAIRRTVGMVFQNPDNQIVANVVEEDGSPLPACWLWSRNASCWMRPPPCWTRWAGGRCSPPFTG